MERLLPFNPLMPDDKMTETSTTVYAISVILIDFDAENFAAMQIYRNSKQVHSRVLLYGFQTLYCINYMFYKDFIFFFL